MPPICDEIMATTMAGLGLFMLGAIVIIITILFWEWWKEPKKKAK